MKPAVSTSLAEVFDAEWNSFCFNDEELFRKASSSYHQLVPVFEDKYKDKAPKYIKAPEDDSQELQSAVQQFL